MSYLIESQEGERAFLRRLWGMWQHLSPMLLDLGFHPHCCWALIEVEMRDLVTGPNGDVDIFVGSTTWEEPKQFDVALADHMKRAAAAHPNALIHFVSPEDSAADMVALSGGLQWPPSTEFVVGIEVKCSRLDASIDPQKDVFDKSDMKSTKSSKGKKEGIWRQLDKLVKLRCDKVALLDIIVNPPTDGIDINAWLNASLVTNKTEAAMSEVLSDRIQAGSPSGHWVYSVGAVAGGDEVMRGAGLPKKYRASQQNTYTFDEESIHRRKQMRESVAKIFSAMPKPLTLPVLFINCRVCKTIHRCSMNASCCQ